MANRLNISRTEIAYAAGRDAANRQMRAEGRAKWSRKDYNVFVRETNRILDGRDLPDTKVVNGITLYLTWLPNGHPVYVSVPD